MDYWELDTVLLGWTRWKLCPISSTIRRVAQPEALSLTPCSYMSSRRCFPSSSTKVTSVRSTETRPLLGSAASRHVRSNSSTHGPVSLPSTRRVVAFGFFVSVIRNMLTVYCPPVPVPVALTSRPVTWGSFETSHPPPNALIRKTAEVIRRVRILTAACSSFRAALCAVMTSR